MGKVQIKAIGAGGLFIHRKRLLRSMGYLVPGSHSITAERIKTIADHAHFEVYDEAADFADELLVEPCGAERYFEFLRRESVKSSVHYSIFANADAR